MKIAFSTLLTVAGCALVTSCYPPYPPDMDPRAHRQVPPPVQKDTTTVNDEGQRQLDEARRRLEEENRMKNPGMQPGIDQPTIQPPTVHQPDTNLPPVNPPTTTYQYASKVPGKAGYVFNPFTQNQVDVRGIPSGTLVRDPNDSNPSHKFRVP